ncbi:HIG1 domain family member 1C-like [Calliopsis andreniformis]|uniref:HIG1 domain family member 1C-like n=1 Tax=Calliopsis andreniformis TaxID=337506 RepID=UPI003FCC9534
MDQIRSLQKVEIPEEALKQTLEKDESLISKLQAVTQKSPFLVASIIGFAVVGGIGIHKWKTRKIPISLFLIQLRVAAQGTAIGFLSLGMAYHLFKDHIVSKDNKEQ